MKYKFSEFYNKELIKEARFRGRSTGLTSKMWILPNGRVVSTGSKWHYQWALENKKNLEKLGITFKGKEEDTIRIELIKQGMFRLNHEARGNRVTIEGLQKYFKGRVKDAILGLVMEHTWDFAYLRIVLFNESVTNIVKDRAVNLVGKGGKEKVDSVSDLLGESIEVPTENLKKSERKRLSIKIMREDIPLKQFLRITLPLNHADKVSISEMLSGWKLGEYADDITGVRKFRPKLDALKIVRTEMNRLARDSQPSKDSTRMLGQSNPQVRVPVDRTAWKSIKK